jgi:hypothetical protein
MLRLCSMGNCINLEQDIVCGLCNSEVNIQYFFCAYCHKRFHLRCIKKHTSGLRECPECHKPYLRAINTVPKQNIMKR